MSDLEPGRRAKKRKDRQEGGEDSSEAGGEAGRKHENARMVKQVELLRSKFFVLQEALVRSGVVNLEELGGPLSDISPLEIQRTPGATRSIFAFAGMATQLSMPPMEFFRALSSAQQAGKPMNFFYAKDFYQCWYQRGLLGLTTDVPGTAKYLGDLLAPDNRSIVTLGMSAGGFASILFGVLLNAQRIVAFGPQTALDRRVFKRFRSTDSRQKDVDLDGPYMDLREVLTAAGPSFTGRIEIHYGANNETDHTAAQHLAGLPQVTLIEHGNSEHAIARALRDSGELGDILADILKE